jgi:hypothetical protein
MATNDKWSRWESYQKTGKWPETAAQQKAREAKERESAEGGTSEPSHSVASSTQFAEAPKVESTQEPKEDFVSRVVREWWERHPHLK